MIAAEQFRVQLQTAEELRSPSPAQPIESRGLGAKDRAWTRPAPAAGIRRLWPARLLSAVLGLAVVTAWAGLNVWAPSDMPTGKTVTAEQLWQEFDRTLPPDVWVAPLENSQYEVISAKWMRRSFLPALKRQMKELRERSIPEDNSAGNCNGLALVCRLMLSLSAMDAHARAPATATVIVRQEHAFGGLGATMENHSVAFVLTDEGSWIIEAQSGEYTRIADYPNRGAIKLVSVH